MTYAIIAISFLSSILMLRLAKALAHRFNLMDVPGGRKDHAAPTPTTGGIAMFLTFAVMVMLVGSSWPPSILIGMGLMALLGIVDDKLHLQARLRLILQAAIAFGSFAAAGVNIHSLGNLFGQGTVELGWLAWPFTIVCVCGLINAINMIDGLDGLAGGIVSGCLALIIIAQRLAGVETDLETYILFSVIVGFLVMNARYPGNRKASIFMGDGGSYFLGFTLAYMICRLGTDPQSGLPPMGVAWILAYPVLSTVRVMVSRLLRRESPFLADRDHLHQLLVDHRGLSVGVTVSFLLGINMLIGTIGVAGVFIGISEPELFIGFLALLPIIFLITAWARNSAEETEEPIIEAEDYV